MDKKYECWVIVKIFKSTVLFSSKRLFSKFLHIIPPTHFSWFGARYEKWKNGNRGFMQVLCKSVES